jgi:hypothetical protein
MAIDLASNTVLVELDVRQNYLKAIDLTNNRKITNLWAHNNNLSSVILNFQTIFSINEWNLKLSNQNS